MSPWLSVTSGGMSPIAAPGRRREPVTTMSSESSSSGAAAGAGRAAPWLRRGAALRRRRLRRGGRRLREKRAGRGADQKRQGDGFAGHRRSDPHGARRRVMPSSNERALSHIFVGNEAASSQIVLKVREAPSGREAGAPLLGAPQHVIGRLDRLEALRRLLVAGLHVGMVGLGQPALGGLDRLEIGIDLQLEHVERAHLVAAAAAVARARPSHNGWHWR